MLYHLSEDTAVSTSYDKYPLRIEVRVHRKLGDHFLVPAIASGTSCKFAVSLSRRLTKIYLALNIG